MKKYNEKNNIIFYGAGKESENALIKEKIEQ